MEDLKAIQHQVQNKVAREEEAGDRQTLETVQVWLTRVESIDIRFSELDSASFNELQLLCIFGKCSKNGCSSYKYGKKIALLLEDVKKLKLEGNFEEVSESAPRSVVEDRPTQSTIGQEKMPDTTWNRLKEDGVGIMGLHGMSGVGKTTLFKKIHNKLVEMVGRFDIVIWIVVSQGTTISQLQDDIANRLKLCSERWINKNESDKAVEMYTYLKKKRFVLMLDDIWEKVDLEAIGVPFPTRENGCKVAFTTRSLEVCGRMGDHEPMHVKCLGMDEAWELFKKKVGDNTLKRDNEITKKAREVAEKCRGLPLALSVIGETMASKSKVQEWDHALDILTRSAAEFSDMENKILPVLKFTYENLVGPHIQSCFLYCALFHEDAKINKERLIDYWICERFMGENQVLERAKNKGYDILGTLVRANLLIEELDTEVGVKDDIVVMHDVVREMALWIASDYGKQKETFVVRARVGLCEIPIVKDLRTVKRMSLMDNNIEEITSGSRYPQLTTLFLQNNKLKNLSGEFIGYMPKLVVLDLSANSEFSELPEQISKLVSLQYIDLSFTSIEQLPVGFQELKKLAQLNLTYTERLHSIRGISKLLSLRILKLQYSKACEDVSLVNELQLLEQLQFLNITIYTELGLQTISGNQRLANCIEALYIRDFQQTPFDISLLMSMKNLLDLRVRSCHVWEIDTYMKRIESKKDSSKSTIPWFTNLFYVCIFDRNSITDLTWLLFTPNLVTLQVTGAEEVKEIIKKEKGSDVTGIIPFQKLRNMFLRDLPKLESICWTPLPFPLLKKMILHCPKLRKLPLDVSSVQKIEEFIIEMHNAEQETDLEWEDEKTRNRFLHSFKRDDYPDPVAEVLLKVMLGLI